MIKLLYISYLIIRNVREWKLNRKLLFMNFMKFYVKDFHEFHNNNENAINFSRILNIDIIRNSITIIYNKY